MTQNSPPMFWPSKHIYSALSLWVIGIADEESQSTLIIPSCYLKQNKLLKPFAMAEGPELTVEDRSFSCKIMRMNSRDRPTAKELLEDLWFYWALSHGTTFKFRLHNNRIWWWRQAPRRPNSRAILQFVCYICLLSSFLEQILTKELVILNDRNPRISISDVWKADGFIQMLG